MTNFDLHVFKTRDGKWKVRVRLPHGTFYTTPQPNVMGALGGAGLIIQNEMRERW